MNETDAMKLLAQANPVQVEELNDLALPAFRARRPQRRLVLATAVLVAATAASLIGVFAFGGSPKQQLYGRLLSPLPTVEHPLRPDAKEATLSEAAQELGAQIVLPESSLAGSADVGPIWTQHTGPVTDVAVTFPGPGLIVDYERPVPYPEPVPTMYATEARQSPDSTSTIELDDVPALATDQNSDQLHQNFGAIEFVLNGTVVRVMGHYDQATLQTVAQSIVDRSPAATSPASQNQADEPGVPDVHAGSLAAADALLPFAVIFPSARPLVIEVSPPHPPAYDTVVVHTVMAFFDTPETGPYVVGEGPPPLSGEPSSVPELRRMARACRSRYLCPIHKIVVLRGTHVLLIGAPGRPGGLTVYWLRHDRPRSVLTWIQGPEDYAHGGLSHHVFRPAAALAVAGSIIAQGG